LQNYSLIQFGLESHNIIQEHVLIHSGILSIKEASYFLSTIYLISLFLLLLNINPRLQFLILFATGGYVIPFSLETFLKNIINFGCLLISNDAWKMKKYSLYDSTAIYLIGFCLTLISTFAGCYKILDPVWMNSLGLYYSLNIPFFMPKPLWFFLDYEIPIRIMNWIVIIAEASALPLFIYYRTRFLALLIVGALGTFLTIFMANIGLVGGATVLASCTLLLSCKHNSEKKEIISF
jgi:hypothetical protein